MSNEQNKMKVQQFAIYNGESGLQVTRNKLNPLTDREHWNVIEAQPTLALMQEMAEALDMIKMSDVNRNRIHRVDPETMLNCLLQISDIATEALTKYAAFKESLK